MIERRTVLVAGGSVAVVGLLAACGMAEGEGAENEGAENEGAAAPAAAPAGALASLSQVPVGGGFVNQESAIVVTQPEAGQVNGFTAVCPHQGCLVSQVVDNEIVCPCHNSRFSAVDGAVISGPAMEGLAAADVAVEGDNVILR